ncbi:MAG: GTP-binding protein [Asgard group archaeon]|nr:GTP-binding protein [Asgard group archaeon]
MSKVGQDKARVVLFCGLSNAGKTTILNIFTKGDVFKTSPTIGKTVSNLPVDDMNFRIFDLAGQKRFRDEIIPLLPFADIIIFVIDASNKRQIREANEEFQRILDNSNKRLTPICILRHKADKKYITSEKTIIKKLDLDKIIDRNWKLLSTSAVTLVGLVDLYKWILQETAGIEPKIQIDKKHEEGIGFHYPCPMMREQDNMTYCLNKDAFIETDLQNYGFHEEVTKMVLEALPDLKKECLETTGKLICPDFCIRKKKEVILRCPVTNYQIETRKIKISVKRYTDAVMLSKIYGQKIGEEICRECIYKILTSPGIILSEEDIRSLKKSFL